MIRRALISQLEGGEGGIVKEMACMISSTRVGLDSRRTGCLGVVRKTSSIAVPFP